jgi:hypothetical protein
MSSNSKFSFDIKPDLIQIKADQINLAKAFPKISPNGVDLGGDSVYLSNGFGDWVIGGSEVQ